MKHVTMIAFTRYSRDTRIKREAEALVGANGSEVTVFTTKEGEKARKYEWRGVRVRESRLPKYQGSSLAIYFLSYLVFTFLSFCFCFAQLVRGRLNVVHVHNMPNFLIFGALPVKLRGGKIILDVHDTMVETYAAKFQEGRKKLLLKVLELEESVCTRLADAVIAVNEPQAEVLVQRGVPRKKITIVMNVPDDGVFDYRSSFFERNTDGSFRTVYHGTVAKRNGVDMAIRAVAGLRGRIPGIELDISGAGDYLAECRDLVGELDAGNFIRVSGGMASEEVVGFLQNMDLEIVPNRRSPASELMLPVKLMESVALGLPVVTARLPTIEHYFSEEMVFFFEPDDLDSLVGAILRASENRKTCREKARNAKDFLKRYGWDIQKQGLLGLYEIPGAD